MSSNITYKLTTQIHYNSQNKNTMKLPNICIKKTTKSIMNTDITILLILLNRPYLLHYLHLHHPLFGMMQHLQQIHFQRPFFPSI